MFSGNVGVTGIMLCSNTLASIPLTVGIVAGYLIEEGLLLESLVWVFEPEEEDSKSQGRKLF
jgi:hypothetical protein